MLLLGKHQLDPVTLFGSREASWTVIRHYWQLVLQAEVAEQSFSASNERPNDSQVARINCVVGLHGPQHTVVEGAHHKGFSQIVEVLPHSDHVITLSSRAVVNHASLHSGAERAD